MWTFTNNIWITQWPVLYQTHIFMALSRTSHTSLWHSWATFISEMVFRKCRQWIEFQRRKMLVIATSAPLHNPGVWSVLLHKIVDCCREKPFCCGNCCVLAARCRTDRLPDDRQLHATALCKSVNMLYARPVSIRGGNSQKEWIICKNVKRISYFPTPGYNTLSTHKDRVNFGI